MTEDYGTVTPPSTASSITFVALKKSIPASIVGRLVYFDTHVDETVYRSVGTITDITTKNTTYNDAYKSHVSGKPRDSSDTDLREGNLKIQAVYRKRDSGSWEQFGAALPTSPSTNDHIYLLTEDVVEKMLEGETYPSIGYFRGMSETPLPIDTPNFDTSGVHSGVLGRSGSGKLLSLDTPIPTPKGWTTMGDLKDGDYVFDSQGIPTRVVKAHETDTSAKCYEVIFSDGSKIKAGAEHYWYTETSRERKSLHATRTEPKQANAIRKTIIPEKMLNEMAYLLKNTSTEETISKEGMIRLLKVSRGTQWVTSISRTLPIVGFANELKIKGYESNSFNRLVQVNTYPEDTYETLAANKTRIKALGNSIILEKVLKLAGANTERPRTKDVAEALEVGTENARKILSNLQLVPVKEQVSVKFSGAVYPDTVANLSTPVALYSKFDFLKSCIEHGSQIWNDQRNKKLSGSVRTTQEIKDSLLDSAGKINHSIELSQAVQYEQKDLPIEPYLFGAWLGDGSSYSGVICGVDDEIMIEAVSRGAALVSTKVDPNKPFVAHPLQNWKFENFVGDLRKLGVLKTRNFVGKHSKFIPGLYLQGSIQQRRDLLAGLMDTDGNTTKSASVEFTNTNKALADGVLEIACSLGYRATMVEKRATLYGVDHGPKYTVRWSTKDDVFLLPRKVESHRLWSVNYNEAKNNRRYIIEINEIPSIPMRCITVDSPTSLYLAGNSFIPTHNTQIYGMAMATSMRHEDHAIMVIDPQGQWANENGMILSVQNMAKGLGRDVSVLRVAHDIRLPMDEDIFARMVTKLQPWRRFRRMGTENQEAFSDEVARGFGSLWGNALDADTRDILTDIFADIALSQSALSRIYVPGERQNAFRDQLLILAGEPLPIDPATDEQPVPSKEELAEAEKQWDALLSVFKPLHSLFKSKNVAGGTRREMSGPTGFLTEVFQVREKNPSKPAPYVVLDMAPDVVLHASAGLERDNESLNMQKLLDNQEVKALILMIVLAEMKKASEVAFASGDGLLNVQMVFDEAWRFAPEGRSTPEIEELANMLEGFALDTRKFGIGWTYILQTPSDLKTGIWRQLTYVYTGYGLIGEDVKRLETLTDDPKQIDLYRQFIAPKATGEYPFMILGPISPLIFTTAPTFLNAFHGTDEFLQHNKSWINEITKRRSLPSITPDYMKQSVAPKKQAKVDSGDGMRGHKVGKPYETVAPSLSKQSREETRKSESTERMNTFVEKAKRQGSSEIESDFPF